MKSPAAGCHGVWGLIRDVRATACSLRPSLSGGDVIRVCLRGQSKLLISLISPSIEGVVQYMFFSSLQ